MATTVLNGLNLANQRIQALADPSVATDAANKQYVDALLAGLTWKTAVRAATTANGTLASAFENGDTIDGVALVTGDRILIKNQSAGQENGIYTVNVSGAPTRATDADTTAELHNATVFIREGTVNADTAYTQTATVTTVGTTPQVWVQFGAGGGAVYTAGGGLTDSPANTFNVGEGNGINVAADDVSVDAGAGLTFSTGALVVGAGTGITVNADDVAINPSVVVRKAAFNTAAATSTVCNHNLNTRDVTVAVVRTTGSFDAVITDWEATDVNNVTVRFAVATTAGEYRIVIHG
jgi:hypothetical protein